MVWIAVGLVGSGVAAPVAGLGQSNEQLEIAKGREAMGRTCTGCHRNILGVVGFQRKSREQWRDTVYSMIGRGAQILPDEIEPIASYLVANFGPNSAPPASRTETSGSTPAVQGGLAQQLPDSEGRSILLSKCQQCHDLEMATEVTGAQDDWNTTVSRMVSYGAIVTPAEQEILIAYLNGWTQSRGTR